MDNRFDGDVGSALGVYSDEAIREVNEYLNSTRAYLGTNGQFSSSIDVTTVALALHNLTGD